MPSEQVIQQALQALQEGKFSSLRAAAAAFGIDHTTLSRRRRGQKSHPVAAEVLQLLSKHQEEVLVEWLMIAEKAGHAYNHTQLREMAALVAKGTNSERPYIGKNWVQGFLKRNPTVKTKKGKSIVNERVVHVSQASVSEWFRQLLAVIEQYKIKTHDIWNMDEVGTTLGPCSNQTVLGSSKSSSALVTQKETREWVTTIECVSSLGKRLRPMIIFKGKHVQAQWFDASNVPDWLYTSSANAFTSNDIGLEWLQSIFIPTSQGDSESYRLLLLDGHASHCNFEFMLSCYTNRIIPFYLIAKASHILQPLDLTCFSSLKRMYRAEINTHSYLDEDSDIRKHHFIKFYEQARNQALSKKNIISGFETVGIRPWSPDKVLQSSFILKLPSGGDKVPKTPKKRRIRGLRTPRNSQELRRVYLKLPQRTALDRKIRRIFEKTAKGIDDLACELGTSEKNLAVVRRTANDLKIKNQKRKAVDLNARFVTLVDILSAQGQEGVEEQAPAATTSCPKEQIIQPIRDQDDTDGEMQVATLLIAMAESE